MGRIIKPKGRYNTRKAVDNTIRYITRSRKNEDRANELKSFGGRGVTPDDPEKAIMEMKKVQEAYNIEKRKGRRVYHEMYLLDDADFEGMGKNYNNIDLFAYACSGYFYKQGFQVEYAVHESKDNRTHVHFVVNSINGKTGKKFHDFFGGLEARQQLFDEMAKEFYTNIPILSKSFQSL